MREPQIGDLVRVTVLDHCQNSTDLIVCTVCGRIVVLDQAKVVLTYWESDTPGNDETVCLIRSAVLSITILGETT